MCGFLVCRVSGDNSRISLRGPDHTATVRLGGLTFVHNLLHVTGKFTPQPFIDGDVVCVYNGEIYNHPFERSDGEVLIPLYRRYGVTFPRYLDGEFALALYDFGKSIAVFATDPFKTKPLFVNGLECASYRSGVSGEPAEPNQVRVVDFDGRTLEQFETVSWDLAQFKESYDDWIRAFEHAVRKRAVPECFIGLSSGYDSGGLACALTGLGIRFKAYVYERGESPAVLKQRCRSVNCEQFIPERPLLDQLRLCVDNEPYTIEYDGRRLGMSVLDDGATLGVATIARLARTEGRKVMLSGQGADEVMTDYSPWPEQSELKGHFPEVLRLWRNFNHGCQESYLMKEEYASGAFGVENRYPYLDRSVVQEFLSLSAAAKNRSYKAPLREYLVRHGYPFEEGVKRGFDVRPD
jgi:asparagine synthetase B (glutamine-hydrolysing)